MAHFLGLALVAEGPTDYHFLRPLLRRLAEQVCAERARGVVEIPDVLELCNSPGDPALRHLERVRDEALKSHEGWHVLFVHSDGAGDPGSAFAERIDPVRSLVEASGLPGQRSIVGVVPVREMEAWAIADGEAVRRAFGTSRSNAELGLPERPAEAERILDPKRALADALTAARSGRRSRRARKASSFLDLIAEHADLATLDSLPAFARLRDEFGQTLRTLGYVS
jgi:hypothetical protein